MQLLPLAGAEGAVHGGADVDDAAVLRQLGPHQLRHDHVHQELLHLILPNLDAALNLLKRDLAPENVQ